jgi:hypothetical protein
MSESLIQLLLTKTTPLVAKIYSMKAGAPVVEEADPDPRNKQRKAPARKGIWAKFSV